MNENLIPFRLELDWLGASGTANAYELIAAFTSRALRSSVTSKTTSGPKPHRTTQKPAPNGKPYAANEETRP